MFKLNRKSLAAELSLLQSVLEARTTMPILAYARIEVAAGTATLTATRLDATVSVTLPCEGDDESYCLPLAQLRDAVRLFSDETVKLQRDDNRVEVTAGRARHRLPVREAGDFPQADEVAGTVLQVDAAGLLDAITRVSPCIDKRDGRYATQGVCLEAATGELNVIAFDGTQAGIVRLMDTDLTFQGTVPTVALPALRALLTDRGTATLTIGENGLAVECEGRRLTVRLLAGQFPPWRMIVPADALHEVTLTTDVRDAIRRCCVTASEGNLVRRRLKLEFGHDALTVRSYGGDGESVEEVAVGCATLNGEPLVVKINADQMLGFLEQVDAPVLRVKDAVSILLLSEGNHRYLHATLRPDA